MPDQRDPPPGTFYMATSRIWRDTGFRGALNHPVVAADLLRLACAQAGIADLDPRALRREPTRQIGPDLAQAENDLIWSHPDAWPDAGRTYFLIEVQSTKEPDMALRMLRYVTLHGFQVWNDHGLPLPVTVPIVFYTGEQPWDLSLYTGALYAAVPPEFRPLLRYVVVDLYRLEVPEGSENIIELLALVVRGETEAEVLGGAKGLYNRLVPLGHKRLEESFFDLVLAQCDQKWPDENWEDCSNMAELVREMEDRVTTWPEKWKANYIAQGHAKGVAQGHAKGVAEGHAKGVAEGRVGQLVSMAHQRFGEAVASTMSVLLGSVRTESALDEVGTWLLTCETGDALIAKIRQL